MKPSTRAALVAAPAGLALAGALAVPANAAAPRPPLPSQPQARNQAAAPQVPAFDFKKECAPLPAGQDPALAVCLGLVVTDGTMKLGGLSQQISKPLRIVVQAAQASPTENSKITSVRMSGRPMKVPGGVTGLLGLPIPGTDDLPFFKVEVQAKYAGGFEFELPNAKIGLKIKIRNDALGAGCFIGSRKDPMKLDLAVDFSKVTIVDPGDPADPFGHPTVLNGPAEDNAFAVPKTAGCGLPGPLIDWKVGLPSPSGKNAASFNTYIALGQYAAPSAQAARSGARQNPLDRLRALKIG